MGCVTPMGIGGASRARGLRRGEVALGPLTLFDTPWSAPVGQVGDIPRPPSVGFRQWEALSRCDRMAIVAALEALEAARCPGLRQAALCAGLSSGEMFEFEQSLYGDGPPPESAAALTEVPLGKTTSRMARLLGVGGPVSAVTSACSSATNALGLALDMIREGEVDVAVAGGADALCRLTVAGFSALAVVSARGSHPFDADRDGLSLSEGAAFVVLESEEHARARGVAPVAELMGYGASSDAYHPTRLQPDGLGAARALRAALVDAGIEPDEVDHVNAHGTGTPHNDAMEAVAIREVFGDGTDSLAVTSNKSLFGHALGSCGALSLAAAMTTLAEGFVAPTAGLERLDPDAPALDVVTGAARPGRFERVVCNSFGFGGSNAALVVGRWGGRDA